MLHFITKKSLGGFITVTSQQEVLASHLCLEFALACLTSTAQRNHNNWEQEEGWTDVWTA